MIRVGVLALQGDVEPHARVLRALGHEPRAVRAPGDLVDLTHLVLPGGESTTLARLMALFGLDRAITAAWRAGGLSLLGTCAGAILLGRCPAGDDPRPPRLGLADVDVARNAYGRQVHSARRALVDGDGRHFQGSFIRAPRFTRVGPGFHVRVRDAEDGAPVLLEGERLVLATWHPELGGEGEVHGRFLGGAAARASS